MEIHLNENYYLISNTKKWSIKKKREYTNKKTKILKHSFEMVSEHSNPKDALISFGEMRIRQSEGTSFKELIKAYDEYSKFINEKLKVLSLKEGGKFEG